MTAGSYGFWDPGCGSGAWSRYVLEGKASEVCLDWIGGESKGRSHTDDHDHVGVSSGRMPQPLPEMRLDGGNTDVGKGRSETQLH